MQQIQESLKHPVQLIVDKGGKLSRQYEVLFKKGDPGFETSGLEQALPSKFLINKKGCIVWKDLAPGKERPSLEVILDAIDTHLKNTPQ